MIDLPVISGSCEIESIQAIRGDGLDLSDPFPVGFTSITWYITDFRGIVKGPYVQSIIIATSPVFKTVDSIQIGTDAGSCSGTTNIPQPELENVCGEYFIEGTREDGLALNEPYPLGATNIIWTASNGLGVSADPVIQTVTVLDTEPPVILCPEDIVISASYGETGKRVNYFDFFQLISDNCEFPNFELIEGLESGEIFPFGTTQITYRATDPSGNYSECSFNVTILEFEDKEDPEIFNCPSSVYLANQGGSCGRVVSWTIPTATDDSGALSFTNNLPNVNILFQSASAFFPVGTTTVIYTARDPFGKTTICSFDITIIDEDAPVIFTNGNQIVSTDAGQCAASVDVSASATDNCTVGEPLGIRSDGIALTEPYPVGVTTIAWHVSDANGNAAALVIQTITVNDAEGPVITCPANITTNVVFGETGKVVNYDLPVATDNCGTPTLQLTAGLASGAVFPLGTTTVSYEATDAAGNKTSCSFTVTVTEDADAIDPIINDCPTDITVSNDAGDCSAAVDWTVPTATDNSGSVTLTSNFDPGAVFPVGTTLVTYTATDAAGNQTSCSFNVNVDDDELPVIGSVSDISVSVPSGQTVTSVSVPEPSVSDNCSATVTGVRSDGEPLTAPYPVGETIITWSAVDASGNPAVDVPQKVTVSQVSANQSVVRFVLVNAATDQDLFELTQGMQISQNLVQGIPLNIRAETNPALVGSVFMRLTGAVNASKTENVAPYALFGDNNGNYSGRTLPTGNYTMYSMPYTQTNRRGTAGDPLTVNFSIVPAVVPVTGIAVSPSTATIEVGNTVQLTATVSPSNATNKGVTWSSSNGSVASVNSSGLVTGNAVGQAIITATTADGGLTASATINVQAVPNLGIVSFTLINAGTDQDMFELSNGMVINQSLVQELSLNIRANTNPSIVGSVLFTLSGPVNRTATENEAPYAIFGDRNGNYSGRTLPAGTYTLSARAYSNRNRGGTAGPIKTITFTINSPVVRLDGSQASDKDNNSTETEMNVRENGAQSVEIMTGALKVYPNPITDGRVTVQDSQFKSGKVRYMLYSIHGALVQEGTVEIGEGNTIKLDFSEKVTHAAMYILVLDNENYLGPKRVNLVFE
jgi:hypothetical protein